MSYVTNLDARNESRFEGTGITAGQTLQGNFIRNRITVLKDGQSIPRHLNKHIDYSQCCEPVPNSTNDRSLSHANWTWPLLMTVKTLYVAAYGSTEGWDISTRGKH